MFIIIVSVGVIGLLTVFDRSVKDSVDSVVRKQALLIAEGLLDEINSKAFSAGGYSGNDRAQFDDVDDYHGYDTTGIYSADGTAISDLSRYNVSVSVNASSASLGGLNAPLVKSIRVQVSGAGEEVALTGYRINNE